jgi:hypothetical protein
MAPRRHDHRRPFVEPHHIADDFASGCDVQDHEDWLRLVWWVDVPGNSSGARCKVRSIVLPNVLQEMRGGTGHGREARRH